MATIVIGAPDFVDAAQHDDRELHFTTRTGRMWRERNFYRDLWCPAQEASGLDIRPHECRHSYVTHLRAAGVNDADLAEVVGHQVRDYAGPLHAPSAHELSADSQIVG
jgi:site-specific recombinase XerC